jgi:cell division protein FtsW
MALISRKDRGLLARWWFTVDWWLLGAAFILMALGVIFSLAASPPVAERIGLDGFHFFRRHLVFLFPAAAMLVGMSMLDARQARRVALALYGGGLVLMVAALLVGPEIKGAHRWINLGPLSIQPSEFVKPGFLILAGWFLAVARQRPDVPATAIAWGLYGLFAGLLVLQPDMGQTILITGAWAGLLFLSGMRWRHIFMLAGLGVIGAVGAWFAFPHVRARIDRFLNPPQLPDGARDQMDFALEAFRNGGLLGLGPGGGIANKHLPDAHTDFIFAAVGEEFGFVAVMLVVLLYAFVVLRLLLRAGRMRSSFRRLAVSGLAVLFGLQAFINMGVNVQLLPAKGMTLPLISYGGSSLWAAAIGLGLALALLREDEPEPEMAEPEPGPERTHAPAVFAQAEVATGGGAA